MRTQQFTFVRSITWVFCFLSYTAARMDSESTRYLVIYAQIIVQFAQCHGGTGWLINDQLFWQQAAMGGRANTPWRKMNNSSLSATPQVNSSGVRQASVHSARVMIIWR